MHSMDYRRKPGQKAERNFFAAVTEEDLARERQVEQIVAENIEQWQQQGWCRIWRLSRVIKPMSRFATRGWTYWHHLFNARHLLLIA